MTNTTIKTINPRVLIGFPSLWSAPETKKADVIKYPEACDHVGLLVNEPPGTAGLLFI